MVVDTSIAVAIVLREPGDDQFVRRILAANSAVMSAVSYTEASMVLVGKRGPGAELELDRMLERARIAIIPVSVEQARIAREAFIRFGKGRHRAKLNFGDCFAYALARQRSEALLFIGNDFGQTDIKVA